MHRRQNSEGSDGQPEFNRGQRVPKNDTELCLLRLNLTDEVQ
jgi:hypothetical protein